MASDSAVCPALGVRARSILDAARTCFERYGFHAASMGRIADEADISVGHIYRYFANKEAVVAAIVSQDLDEISEDIDRLTGSPDELADHILQTFVSDRYRQKMILRLEVLAEGARNPKIADMISCQEMRIRSHIRKTVANAIQRQQPRGEIGVAEMEMRISLAILLMEGLQIRAFQEGAALPEGLTKQVRGLLIQAFSSAPITTDAVDRLLLRRG